MTHEELVVAMEAVADGPFPLPEDATTSRMLAYTVEPAVESLPPHLRCEAVREALKSVFVMGLSAGVKHAS